MLNPQEKSVVSIGQTRLDRLIPSVRSTPRRLLALGFVLGLSGSGVGQDPALRLPTTEQILAVRPLGPESQEGPVPVPELPPLDAERLRRLAAAGEEDRLRQALVSRALTGAKGPPTTQDHLAVISLGVAALGGLIVGAWLLLRGGARRN